MCYYNGLSVDRIVLTLENFRTAAGSGVPGAQLYLGNMYITWEDVERDLTEAVNWFRKAAKRNKTDVQFNVDSRVRERRRRPAGPGRGHPLDRLAAKSGIPLPGRW